jgi:hypothetical protein
MKTVLMKVRCITWLTLFFLGVGLQAQNLELKKRFWFPKGDVRSIVYDSIHQRIYLGGNFSTLGPQTPYGSVVGIKGLKPDPRYPFPDNEVRCVIPDGNNGWFIGGKFSKIGDSSRNRIAHINSDGRITTLFSGKGFNKEVSTLMLRDSILYIGGKFTGYGSLRKDQVVFDTITKRIDTKFPLCNGLIKTAISDNRKGWFVAGTFTIIGDSARYGLAHIDSNGIPSLWNPEQDGTVTAMALDGDALYLAGTFSSIAGVVRYRIAAVGAKSGYAYSLNPAVQTGSTFTKLLVRKNTLYVVGKFTSIGGQTRTNLAALDVLTSKATTWDPKVSGVIRDMLYVNNTMYLAGEFTSIATKTRNYIAAVSLSGTGALTAWNPSANTHVLDLKYYNGYIVASGAFNQIGTAARNNIALIDTLTGLPSSWNPQLNAKVNRTVLDGDRLFVAGEFTKAAGAYRSYFALFNLATSSLDTTKISIPSYSDNIAASGSKIFLGGFTGDIADISRNALASVNIRTGRLTDWNPAITGSCLISSIADLKGPSILVSGTFRNIGGQKRNYIARIHGQSGMADAWNPSPDGPVNALQVYKNKVYVAGSFSSIGGQSRLKLAALDTMTGLASSWSPPNPNQAVNQLLVSDSVIYISGKFTNLNGTSRYIAALNMGTGAVITSWAPKPAVEVVALALKDNTIFAGGQQMMLSIDKKTGVSKSWDYASDDTIYCISAGDTNLYIGGRFSTLGRQARGNFAALDAVSGQLLDWGKGISFNNTVSTMMLKDSTLYIGGVFTKLNLTIVRDNLAAINTRSGQILPWAPSAFVTGKTNDISCMEMMDSMIYIGGTFSGMNGLKRTNLANVHAISGKTGNWDPAPNNIIYAMARYDTTLYVSGSFTIINGQSKRYLAAVSTANRLLTKWNPGITTRAYSLKRAGNTLYMGGDFTTVNSKTRQRIAQLDLLTGALGALDYTLPSGSVYGLLVKDSQLYISGDVGLVDSLQRYQLASVNRFKRGVSSFAPSLDLRCQTIVSAGNNLLAGGAFDLVNGNRIESFAVFGTPCPQPSEGQVKTSVCGKFTFNGVTYYKTGIYHQKRLNYKGCDSLITLDLLVRDTTASTLTVNTCNPSYTLNGTTYSATGTYHQKLVNAKGCDSIITLRLTIPKAESTYKTSACTSFTLNGITYDSSGVYIQKLTGYQGCDSTITLTLSILKTPAPFHVYATTCTIYTLNGKIYDSSGVYTQLRRNYQGCDSAIIVHVKVIKPVTSNVSISTCQSYAIAGKTFTNSGTYIVRIDNYQGCDSLITLKLDILPASNHTIDVSDCNSYTLNGFTYTNTGTYLQKLVNYRGCDSTLTIKFTKLSINTAVLQTGSTLKALATNASFQWVDCNDAFSHIEGQTSAIFYPSKPGIYAVSVFQSGCYALSACYNIRTIETQTITVQNAVRIYPNPAENALYISLDREVFNASFRLMDLTGKIVKESTFSGDSCHINISSLTSGVYILNIETDGVQKNYQVLKQ